MESMLIEAGATNLTDTHATFSVRDSDSLVQITVKLDGRSEDTAERLDVIGQSLAQIIEGVLDQLDRNLKRMSDAGE